MTTSPTSDRQGELCCLSMPSRLTGEWFFEIMIDEILPICQRVEGKKMPIILAERRPTCWMFGEAELLNTPCPKKDIWSSGPADPNSRFDRGCYFPSLLRMPSA